MRIVAMSNEGQLSMLRNMLNSAQKAGWPMHLFHCYLLHTHKDAATYNTAEFQSVTLRKLEVILENLRLDNEVLWIDNDIVLFQNCIAEMRAIHGHFVMQDDLWGPCTGFFLVRAYPGAIRVLEKTVAYMKAQIGRSVLNDQHAFVKVYKSVFGVITSLLPQEEYPNGEVYFNQQKRSKAKMVHNNYLTTTAEKIARFKQFGLWNDDDGVMQTVTRYAI
jgi:hypothetical protein